MNTCWIAGAGEFTPRGFQPEKNDFIIAADGGLKPLLKMGVKPNLLLGDLDSLGSFPLPSDVPLEKFPVEKDDTDTGIALAQGFAMGFRDFRLYGCGGGRIDHLLANFQSMGRYSKLGTSIRLVDVNCDVYAITNTTFALPNREPGTTVSVFSLDRAAEGVTLKGLKYPLDRYTLTSDFPLGVSNQHTYETAEITVENGTLLIIQYLKAE